MRFKSLVLGILALAIFSSSADARRYHHIHHYAQHRHVSHHAQASPTVRGARLNVTPSAAGQFAALVSDFEAMGYSVGSPGCLSSGHMRNSKHHWGGACDLFNQTARNITALHQPPPHVQIEVATRHGLTSGCVWRNPDCGHFEVSAQRR